MPTPANFVRDAFLTGWAHGCQAKGVYSSPREVEERFPAWSREQITAYLNGHDDAIACDQTRLIPIRAARDAARVEQTAQGPQLVIPGGERSAHQAAAARDAAGHGRIRSKKPQQDPGGLFAAGPPGRQPNLFDR